MGAEERGQVERVQALELFTRGMVGKGRDGEGLRAWIRQRLNGRDRNRNTLFASSTLALKLTEGE